MIEHADVIRNVFIHITNEQPLLGDLFDIPSASDAGLLCTNLRTMDGKRPVFVDQIGSIFFFPYHHIRFVEIPGRRHGRDRAAGGRIAAVGVAPGNGAEPYDADGPATTPRPRTATTPCSRSPSARRRRMARTTRRELEIDEDFLRRIRDV